nr:hypothetical protein [Brevundimonas diminuta]
MDFLLLLRRTVTFLRQTSTANSNQMMETRTKSKIEEDGGDSQLNDPFDLFEEWYGEADRQAYRAWSDPGSASLPDAPTATANDAGRSTYP